MSSVSKVIVVGTVHSVEPKRIAGTGEAVVNFTVKTDGERKQKGTGNPRTVVDLHRIAAYKGKAEFASQLIAGDIVYIEGRFHYSSRKVGNVDQPVIDIVSEKLERVHKVPRNPASPQSPAVS